MRAVVVALALLLGGQTVWAQEQLEWLPHVGQATRDPDFRVETRRFGLDRQVEMLQWRRDGDGYELAWNAASIDSSDFVFV